MKHQAERHRIPGSVICGLILLILFSSCRKGDFTVEETEYIRDNGTGTGTVTWTKDREYVIEGLVFVNDGQVLTIEPGTVIRARTGQGAAASALIVARGGRIEAIGTASEPIIFTCEGDDLKGSVPLDAKGLWGGVIILGTASLNNQYNENHIEGIPISEPRGTYGGFRDDDDSGILQYVSIRHSGTKLGEGNEINGLTFGGVGSETTIDHVEVISNLDDGFEFFGGTVNCRYLLAAYCDDDAFDYDEGYRGMGQYWCGIQDDTEGSLLVEANGGLVPENGRPLSAPLLYNLTLVGSGASNGRTGIRFSRNAAGMIGNSILLDQQNGIEVEYKPGVEDSYTQFENASLRLLGNVFYDIAGNVPDSVFRVYSGTAGLDLAIQNENLRQHYHEAGNKVEFPGMIYGTGAYRLIASDYVFEGLAEYPDEWFEQASFQGAFGTYNWASGWTLLSQVGILLD
jgi:hypothetical protein